MEESQSYVVKGVDTGKGEIEAIEGINRDNTSCLIHRCSEGFIWGVERRKTDIC